MSDQDMMDLLLGAAVVYMGYVLYKRHQAKQAPDVANPPIQGIPAPPLVQVDASGNYFFDMNTLLDGAI